jgi:hypothetical protein
LLSMATSGTPQGWQLVVNEAGSVGGESFPVGIHRLALVDEMLARPVCRCAGLDLTRYDGQGRCVDYAAGAAALWWMVDSYAAGLR